MNHSDWSAALTTVQLAAVTTVFLLLTGTPLAWWLARSPRRWTVGIEALVGLPLVLPPTVLGFYLLVLLGEHGPAGQLTTAFGLEPLAFSFSGLVIGSFIYSFPFVVQPLQTAFSRLDNRLLEAAATMGASPADRFFSVVFPLARSGFLTATVLGFAHTVGEFGVVLMIGGNIPGKTRVLSIAIYDHVEALNYGNAHWLSGVLLLLSFCLLLGVYIFNRLATGGSGK